MIPIHYLKGDATAPTGSGPRIIAHVSNDVGSWGKGFVLALSKKWKEPERQFRAWYRDRRETFALGETQFVQVEPELWIANMVAQHKLKPIDDVPPVRYDALDKCLATLADYALQVRASVHMPRIACGLSGGEWTRVEPMIERALGERDIAVFVYDWN